MNNKYFGLHNLSPIKGHKKNTKRVGRGESSGWGKTSGRGHKGQKARKSGSVKFGFEGGQTSIVRRLPKRGFKHKYTYTVMTINIDRIIARFPKGSSIDINMLRKYKFIKNKSFTKIKFINGSLQLFPISLTTNYISKALKKRLTSIGGKVFIIK